MTMWEHGDIRCVVLVAGNEFNVQIFAGEHSVRKHCVASVDEAVSLAGIWETLRPGSQPGNPASIAADTQAPTPRVARRSPRTGFHQQTDRSGTTFTSTSATAPPANVRRYPIGAARGIIF